MIRFASIPRVVALALGLGLAGAALAADAPPQSLLQIFGRLPKAPATLQDADRMVDARLQIAAIATIRADLDAHDAAVERIFAAADAKIRARMGGAANPEQAGAKIAAVAGIDIARMQTDKAYAAEVQARMRSMSPQEMMAMSAALSQGMGMRATVAVYDPPAVKAAADAGQALMLPDQVAARTAAYQRRWSEAERKVTAIRAKYQARFPRMQLICDGEGGGRPECVAERARYINAMMPLLQARDAEVLQVEAAALDEERNALAAQLRTADTHLLNAQYGALSQELGNPTHIMYLDQIYSGDVKALANRLDEVVKRAAVAARCGPKLATGSACDGAQ